MSTSNRYSGRGFNYYQFSDAGSDDAVPPYEIICFHCGLPPDDCYCDDFWLTEEDRHYV